MDIDRSAICEIISEMLDNPDKHGIYPTSTAYTKLEHYINGVRYEAIGWCHAYCCHNVDIGKDTRTLEISEMLEQAIKDLG